MITAWTSFMSCSAMGFSAFPPARLARPRGLRRRYAFTLIELLVVIAIFVLLLALAVPAVSSLMESSEESMAQNALRSGLASARDVAMRSSGYDDGAAVFFYEPGGRLSIVPCVRVGTVQDHDNSPGPGFITREVFVPMPVASPVQLPKGWMVRGYAPVGSMDVAGTNPNGWYASSVYDTMNPNWVFPETGLYEPNPGSPLQDARFRRTFMIRFQAGTGAITGGGEAPAVVVSPWPTSVGRPPIVPGPARDLLHRPDRVDDLRAWAVRVLNDHTTAIPAAQDRIDLIGDTSIDTVLVAPVSSVAVYSERRMAGAVGGGVNRDTGCVYMPPAAGMNPQLTPGSNSDNINQWIQGTLVVNGRNVESTARIFTLQRYLGTPQEALR